MSKLSCIILAAGKGTRMKSARPKVMNTLAGWPLISHVIKTCEALKADTIVTVIASDMDDVATAVAPHSIAIQKQQLGTGDAAKAALPALKGKQGHVLILLGDVPMVSSVTLKKLWNAGKKTGLAVLTMRAKNPRGYGRIITQGDFVSAIVEQSDCTSKEEKINLVNAGCFCVAADKIAPWLNAISNKNKQKEFYLTDIIEVATKQKIKCAYVEAPESELQGINSRAQLAAAEYSMQQTLRNAAMDNGATLIDPATVYFSADTVLGRDVVVEPNVFFGPKVTIADDVTIHAFTHIEGASIDKGASIGPFARIRPKSKIGEKATIGNFVEVNRAVVKAGAKSKHVSYLGDAVIGAKTNIGAGTVIANYDGFDKQDTIIGDRVFIGSNSTLIAPLTIGNGAYIAAASAITTSVPDNALAVARTREVLRDGWADEYRSKKESLKNSKGKKHA
jgi:bifunctional UDP-N-acetylglucosamine pyrophosphorylase/glucosamine-1-phosphate N-acetyltransferase